MASYPIQANDSVEDLQARGHRLEHQMYPQLLRWISETKLSIDADGHILYEQTPLEVPLIFDH